VKVNLIAETSTNSTAEIEFIYKLGSLWEKEHCVKPNKGIMYLFCDINGNKVFCEWMATKGINTQISNYEDIASIVSIDESVELTKLLLES
jgi:hypothetical protein